MLPIVKIVIVAGIAAVLIGIIATSIVTTKLSSQSDDKTTRGIQFEIIISKKTLLFLF